MRTQRKQHIKTNKFLLIKKPVCSNVVCTNWLCHAVMRRLGVTCGHTGGLSLIRQSVEVQNSPVVPRLNKSYNEPTSMLASLSAIDADCSVPIAGLSGAGLALLCTSRPLL